MQQCSACHGSFAGTVKIQKLHLGGRDSRRVAVQETTSAAEMIPSETDDLAVPFSRLNKTTEEMNDIATFLHFQTI